MKKLKHIISGSAMLVLILMTGFVTAGNLEQDKTQDKKELTRVVLKIDNLSCGGCFSTINSSLASLEGYSGMGANLFRKLLAVDFSAPLTPEKISEVLAKAGYPGTLEGIDTIFEKESFAFLESRRTGPASGKGGCCSGGTPLPDNGNLDSGQLLPPGDSCCTLPDVGPTKTL